MASDAEFVEYVCDQLRGCGFISSRKMFGEYMIYVNGKPILLVCDNTVFLKKYEILHDRLADAEEVSPYAGAKPHYILDIDDGEKCCELVRFLEPTLPLPKPKKKKGKDESH